MIGVFDSGVGGLAILQRIRGLLPSADLLFLADQANVPYGERPLDEIAALAEAAVGTLVGLGAETVVIACNTASAAALPRVRTAYPSTSIVGMEPAIKPAAAGTRSGVIGVLATPATFAAAGFEELVGRFAEGERVVAHPCPGWADAVEEGWPDGAAEPVRAHLAPLVDVGVDTIVLACTHYSFLVEEVAAATGAIVVDPADAVARQTARVADGSGGGTTRYFTTGAPERLAAQVGRLLGLAVDAEPLDMGLDSPRSAGGRAPTGE